MNVALNALNFFIENIYFDLPSNDICFTRMTEEDCESESGKTAFSGKKVMQAKDVLNHDILALMAKSLILYFICTHAYACLKNFF